ncbi:DUF3180 domain-containing protein [Homoserinimonas hongtaonis]|uniref:DUF3180 domain-containing protein n=1 Tax=Homoserinimonas hongtaonis TaxID=2079791 RepID=A0A2U1T108_9MICO|nr:DUF3180 domain-containing protein [Salinibacterium hongtaonis]AWB90081.1 DUF3180 domain-containing protein [Salinibacterium hongtaonis]PWB97536.1 DUF3180 domain-containing protein [Salinibacterium hongtaonis]
MKRTPAALVVLIVAIGAGVGLLTQYALASAGLPGLVPPVSLDLVLVAMGVFVVAMAVPIRRAVKGKVRTHVDPFYALRVLVLAKACAISGALLAGIGIGFVVYLLTRTVPALGSVGYSVGMTVGAVLLLVAGLVAEGMCRIPPPSDEDTDDAAKAMS